MIPEKGISYARDFAAAEHALRGHTYDGGPYVKHLDAVVDVLMRFGVKDLWDEDLLIAAYLHDLMEDCGFTVVDLASRFGMNVATLVEAVTNEPGKNREERHRKTYPKIKRLKEAVRLKLADRIANVESCLVKEKESEIPVILSLKGEVLSYFKKRSRLLKMYRKEHAEFVEALYSSGEFEEMWSHLKEMITMGAVLGRRAGGHHGV